jgi:hypothetical protein
MYICKGAIIPWPCFLYRKYNSTTYSSLNAGAWSNGADLKSAVFALVGSNPTSSTCDYWRYNRVIYNIHFALSTWLNG